MFLVWFINDSIPHNDMQHKINILGLLVYYAHVFFIIIQILYSVKLQPRFYGTRLSGILVHPEEYLKNIEYLRNESTVLPPSGLDLPSVV